MVFARSLLDAHDDISVHLEKTAVAIVGKPFVATAFGKGAYGFIIQAKIENGIHHSWHRVAGARADGEKERIDWIAEFFAHGVLDFCDGFVDLPFQGRGIGILVFVEVGADVGTDGESCGYGETDPGHFGKVGPFATQEGLHLTIAICFSAAKGVDVLHGFAKK